MSIPSCALGFPTAPNPIFAGPAFFCPAVCPKPRRPMPMPSLSSSLALLWWPGFCAVLKAACAEEIGVGCLISVVDVAEAGAVFEDACSSAAASYPSFATRSASSLAFFSASSKSISAPAPTTFLAPSFVVFFAPRTLAFLGPPAPVVADLRRAALDVLAADGAAPAFGSALSGETGVPLGGFVLAPLRNGEAVREIPGVEVREGEGDGRLMDGLSQEEKKSSEGSPTGVVPSSMAGERSESTMTTSSGYL